MKRTLVERVAEELWYSCVWCSESDNEWANQTNGVKQEWLREARRIIAMVRRHDKAGKK